MGKLKDRSAEQKTKKDARISFRTSSVLLGELRAKTKKLDNSKAIDEAIKEYLKFKRDPKTKYKCAKCKKKILKQEPYYCIAHQLELNTGSEIIVTKAELLEINCMKCAKKEPDILKFIESEDSKGEETVQESERNY